MEHARMSQKLALTFQSSNKNLTIFIVFFIHLQEKALLYFVAADIFNVQNTQKTE
jgi:hypothetical protein